MITLYGSFRSRTLRPLWLLREIGAPFAWRPVIQAYRVADPTGTSAPFNTSAAEFQTLTPMAQVPVMTDGDLVLTESVAICFYIARRLGGALALNDPLQEAEALNWACLGLTAVETPALDILMAYHRGDPTEASAQATIKASRAALQRPFARIDAHLSTQDWLVDGRFTVADIVLAECVRFAIDDAALFQDFPNLLRWITAARARPVFQALWAERNAEPQTFP